MKRIGTSLILTVLLATGFLGACSDGQVPIGASHPLGKAWIVTSASSHGAAFHAASASCAECHETSSFCNRCHFGTSGSRVPPGSSWVHRQPPPTHEGLGPFDGVCESCHTLMRRYTSEPTACHDCHGEGVPHPTGQPWLDASKATFHGKSSLVCADCHDVNVFCFQCHFGPAGTRVPQGVTSWNHGQGTTKAKHASKDLLTGQQEAICIACHQLTKSYGLGPQFSDCSATTCHGFNYHGTGFADQHPTSAQADLSKCRKCHDTPANLPSFDGYVTGVACATCHTGALAHPPPPATTPDWYVAHRSAGGNRADACGICHKIDAAGDGPMALAPSCFSPSFDAQTCHAGGPGTAPHALGQAWLAKSASFHGNSTLTCSDCHDRNTFCSECHFGPSGTRVPAGVLGWTHDPGSTRKAHASKNLFTSAQQAVCIQCHGLTKSFSTGPTFVDCSTATCHGFDYHGVSFLTQHPSKAKTDLLKCQTCHDAPGGTPNFNGYVTGVPCVDCHTAALAHPPPPASVNWVTSHQTAGNTPAACANCHKASGPGAGPLAGAPSCFSDTFGGQTCHANGPPQMHPAGFSAPTAHGAQAKAGIPPGTGLVFCQQCHADPATGGVGSAPRFNVAKAGLPNGCETCHNSNTAHPSQGAPDTAHWYGAFSHADAENLAIACGLCHGATLATCNQCHKAGSPLTAANCSSCHGAPPAGTNAPDRAGAHAKHDALPKVTGVCNTCHSGAGNRTAKHYDQTVDFGFLSAYAAKSGAAARNSDGTCSNVSCHGGVTTPAWLTGSLDRASACTSCHVRGTAAQTPQYNSPYSGQHGRSNHVSKGCTACHDPAKLEPASQRHFGGLDTPQFETSPATTLKDALKYNGSSCDPASGGLSGCHGTENWID